MTLRNLFFALAAAMGLLGCAGGGMKLASPCNGGVCQVVVTVTDCIAVGGVSVSHDPLPVREMNNIEWVFAAANGYSFPPNGIIIGPDPKRELDKPNVLPNGKKVIVKNKHSQTNYKIYYAVNVTKDDGTPCIPLDPWIVNE